MGEGPFALLVNKPIIIRLDETSRVCLLICWTRGEETKLQSQVSCLVETLQLEALTILCVEKIVPKWITDGENLNEKFSSHHFSIVAHG